VGFKIEDDLNTEHSRQLWLEWKRRIDPAHYLDPKKRADAMNRVREEMIAEGLLDRRRVYGTINCDGVNAKGEICGVTTTSGLAWKIPAGSAIRRFSVPDFMWITKSAPPVRPGAGKRTFTVCVRI
jgi:isoaspartyl peptidase/L-asparaginase-like protein (Ntn-hydrolase superfamily)